MALTNFHRAASKKLKTNPRRMLEKSQYASSPVYAPGWPISTWCIVGGGVLGTLRAAHHSLSPNAASEKFSNACPARHHLHTATPSVMGSNLDRWREGLPPI